MTKLLSAKKVPSAVFCTNDDMALGAIRCAEKMGYSIPDDISITGFNDFSAAKWNNPSITSLHHDIYQLGAECAKLLINEIDTGIRSQTDSHLEYSIVERESVKKIK